MCPVQRLCKSCGRSIIVWSTVQTRCVKCQQARSKAKPPKPLPRPTKPIATRGKHAKLWVTFRDKVAIPYLDKKFGHVCAVAGCEQTEHLDVDHIKNRGSNPDKRYDVHNLQFLCRPHHRTKTDGKLVLTAKGGQEKTSYE